MVHQACATTNFVGWECRGCHVHRGLHRVVNAPDPGASTHGGEVYRAAADAGEVSPAADAGGVSATGVFPRAPASNPRLLSHDLAPSLGADGEVEPLRALALCATAAEFFHNGPRGRFQEHLTAVMRCASLRHSRGPAMETATTEDAGQLEQRTSAAEAKEDRDMLDADLPRLDGCTDDCWYKCAHWLRLVKGFPGKLDSWRGWLRAGRSTGAPPANDDHDGGLDWRAVLATVDRGAVRTAAEEELTDAPPDESADQDRAKVKLNAAQTDVANGVAAWHKRTQRHLAKQSKMMKAEYKARLGATLTAVGQGLGADFADRQSWIEALERVMKPDDYTLWTPQLGFCRHGQTKAAAGTPRETRLRDHLSPMLSVQVSTWPVVLGSSAEDAPSDELLAAQAAMLRSNRWCVPWRVSRTSTNQTHRQRRSTESPRKKREGQPSSSQPDPPKKAPIAAASNPIWTTDCYGKFVGSDELLAAVRYVAAQPEEGGLGRAGGSDTGTKAVAAPVAVGRELRPRTPLTKNNSGRPGTTRGAAAGDRGLTPAAANGGTACAAMTLSEGSESDFNARLEDVLSQLEVLYSSLVHWRKNYAFHELPPDEYFEEVDWAAAASRTPLDQLNELQRALRQRIAKGSDFAPDTIKSAIQTVLPMQTQGSVTLPGLYTRLAYCAIKLALLWVEPSPTGGGGETTTTRLRPTSGTATHQAFGGNSLMSNICHEPTVPTRDGSEQATTRMPDPAFIAAREEWNSAVRECLAPFVIAAFKNHPIFAANQEEDGADWAVAWIVNQGLTAFPSQGSQTDHLDAATLHVIALTALTSGPATVFFKDCHEWLKQICVGGKFWNFAEYTPSARARARYGLDSMLGSGPREPAMVQPGMVWLAYAHVMHRAPHHALPTVRSVHFTMWRLVLPSSELASARFFPKEQIFVHQLVYAAYGAAAARCVETNQQVDRIADASDHFPLTMCPKTAPQLPVGGRNPCAYLGGLPPAAWLSGADVAGAWNDIVIQNGDPVLVATCARISDAAWSSGEIYALPTTNLAPGLFGCSIEAPTVAAAAAAAPALLVDGDEEAGARRGLIALAKALAAHAGIRVANTDGRAHVALATTRAVQGTVAAGAQLEPLSHGHVVFGTHFEGAPFWVRLEPLPPDSLVRVGVCPAYWTERLAKMCTAWNGTRNEGKRIRQGGSFVLSREARWLCTYEIVRHDGAAGPPRDGAAGPSQFCKTMVATFYFQADPVAPRGTVQCETWSREAANLSSPTKTTPEERPSSSPKPPPRNLRVRRERNPSYPTLTSRPTRLAAAAVVAVVHPRGISLQTDYAALRVAAVKTAAWQGRKVYELPGDVGVNAHCQLLPLELLRIHDRNNNVAAGLRATAAMTQRVFPSCTWLLKVMGDRITESSAAAAHEKTFVVAPRVYFMDPNTQTKSFVDQASAVSLARFVLPCAPDESPALELRWATLVKGGPDVLVMVLARDVKPGEFLTCKFVRDGDVTTPHYKHGAGGSTPFYEGVSAGRWAEAYLLETTEPQGSVSDDEDGIEADLARDEDGIETDLERDDEGNYRWQGASYTHTGLEDDFASLSLLHVSLPINAELDVPSHAGLSDDVNDLELDVEDEFGSQPANLEGDLGQFLPPLPGEDGHAEALQRLGIEIFQLTEAEVAAYRNQIGDKGLSVEHGGTLRTAMRESTASENLRALYPSCVDEPPIELASNSNTSRPHNGPHAIFAQALPRVDGTAATMRSFWRFFESQGRFPHLDGPDAGAILWILDALFGDRGVVQVYYFTRISQELHRAHGSPFPQQDIDALFGDKVRPFFSVRLPAGHLMRISGAARWLYLHHVCLEHGQDVLASEWARNSTSPAHSPAATGAPGRRYIIGAAAPHNPDANNDRWDKLLAFDKFKRRLDRAEPVGPFCEPHRVQAQYLVRTLSPSLGQRPRTYGAIGPHLAKCANTGIDLDEHAPAASAVTGIDDSGLLWDNLIPHILDRVVSAFLGGIAAQGIVTRGEFGLTPSDLRTWAAPLVQLFSKCLHAVRSPNSGVVAGGDGGDGGEQSATPPCKVMVAFALAAPSPLEETQADGKELWWQACCGPTDSMAAPSPPQPETQADAGKEPSWQACCGSMVLVGPFGATLNVIISEDGSNLNCPVGSSLTPETRRAVTALVRPDQALLVAGTTPRRLASMITPHVAGYASVRNCVAGCESAQARVRQHAADRCASLEARVPALHAAAEGPRAPKRAQAALLAAADEAALWRALAAFDANAPIVQCVLWVQTTASVRHRYVPIRLDNAGVFPPQLAEVKSASNNLQLAGCGSVVPPGTSGVCETAARLSEERAPL